MLISSKLISIRFALVFLMTGLLLWGGVTQAAQSNDIATELDTFFTNIAEQEIFNGAVLVARDGEIVISKGYGMANLEWDIPNTPQTKFRIASVSKQFTGMALLMLQERGLLTIQDKVCQYVEECPDSWQDITIHHLLTHTSGIPDIFVIPEILEVLMLPSTPKRIIDRFIDEPLDFQPDEGWSYSNAGYILAGYIIEQVADQSYSRFLTQNIFEPLGMTNSGHDSTTRVIKNRATGYAGGGSRIADYIDMSVPYAAGGLYSTVEDLYLWEQALWSGKVVSQETLDAMFSVGAAMEENPPMTYYYGLFEFQVDGHRVVGHSGGINGFTSMADYFPDDNLTIIVLSNYEDVNSGFIAETTAKILFRES